MAVKPIPDGYHTVTPYLTVTDVAKLIEFLQKVFGAEVKEKFMRPDGGIMHAEVKVGDSIIMMGQANENWKARPGTIYMYVPDTDAAYRRALDAGATSVMEPANQFYGDRNAGVSDSTGNYWWIATHVEDVSKEEMDRRHEQHAKQPA
ncbi:MAG: VOC family protein [Terriglobales bacterium]|jgi:uncharacterized glyoxalase superfamily protein PhnB